MLYNLLGNSLLILKIPISRPIKMAEESRKTQKYAAVLVVVLAILFALVAFISQQPGGYIETKGGSTCSWRLEGDAYTERAVLFDCECPGGKKYSCKYQGRPDTTCPPFWRDIFGLFRQIRQAAAGQFTELMFRPLTMIIIIMNHMYLYCTKPICSLCVHYY